jgi:hypothetical protein
MTKVELLAILAECKRYSDVEDAHRSADDALLRYINDPDIRQAFDSIEKWYS